MVRCFTALYRGAALSLLGERGGDAGAFPAEVVVALQVALHKTNWRKTFFQKRAHFQRTTYTHEPTIMSHTHRCKAFTYARFIRLKKVISIATATPSTLLQLCAGGRTVAQARVSLAPLRHRS